MIIGIKITPVGLNSNEFLDEFEGTDYLAGNSAISSISNTVDNSDFVVGLFSYSYTRIKLLNRSGIFNQNDSTGKFPNGRDGSKVTIFLRDQGEEKPVFIGEISEDATKENILNETIEITVLSPDSVLRRHNVPAGILSGNLSFKDAIIALLDRPPINLSVKIRERFIEMDYNGIIDNEESFSGKSIQESIGEILVAGNSFLFVDFNNFVRVLSRTKFRERKRRFYGPYDKLGRSPGILSVKNYNNGLQRTINQVEINGEYYGDQDFINTYSLRSKSISFDFITRPDRQAIVATNLIRKYRVPKQEMTIMVPLKDAYDLEISDLLSVHYPRKRVGINENSGKFGIDMFGFAKFAGNVGAFYINSNVNWIIYGKKDNPSNFTTELKLREYGFKVGDSTLHKRRSIFGTGRFGEATFQDTEVAYASKTGRFGIGKFGSSTFA